MKAAKEQFIIDSKGRKTGVGGRKAQWKGNFLSRNEKAPEGQSRSIIHSYSFTSFITSI